MLQTFFLLGGLGIAPSRTCLAVAPVHGGHLRLMAELGWRPAAHLPKGKNAWDKTHFEVAIVGKQYDARVLSRGPQPFEEAASIESLLRDLREEMRRAQPELGLWYAIKFGLYADGRVMPNYEYDARPAIDGEPAKLSEAQADLARARSAGCRKGWRRPDRGDFALAPHVRLVMLPLTSWRHPRLG